MRRVEPAGSRMPRGFTLVEMLVSIAIIIVLAGILLAVSQSLMESSRRSRAAQLLSKIESALDAYNEEFGSRWMLGPDMDDPSDDVIPDIRQAPDLDTYRRANRAVANIIRAGRYQDDFPTSSVLARGYEIVQDTPDNPGYWYVVDIWFDPADDDHGVDQHMIRLARHGFNDPDLDMWSCGADGVNNVPDVRPDTALRYLGDDVGNWGTR